MVKRVAVIQDLSGIGKCSLTAAIPVLSVLGVQACPLPTAVFSNQTGYETYFCDDYTDRMDCFTSEWQKLHLTFNGIYTGFLENEDQVDHILRFCEVFRRKDTLVLTDPVMGDHGSAFPFFTPRLLSRLRELALQADVITPNLTECCLLAGADYRRISDHQNTPDYFRYIEEVGRNLLGAQLKTVVITGILSKDPVSGCPSYYNIVLDENCSAAFSSGCYGGSYSGTGDLLASVLCGSMVRGDTASAGIARAVRFLEAALKETAAQNIPRNEGVLFEPYLSMLLE